MSTLQVELVAADRKVWEGPANQVSARSIDGDLGMVHEISGPAAGHTQHPRQRLIQALAVEAVRHGVRALAHAAAASAGFSSTVNSSPPRRAIRVPGPVICRVRRSATALRSWSP